MGGGGIGRRAFGGFRLRRIRLFKGTRVREFREAKWQLPKSPANSCVASEGPHPPGEPRSAGDAPAPQAAVRARLGSAVEAPLLAGD